MHCFRQPVSALKMKTKARRISAPNIVAARKTFLIVGCSHGLMADRKCLDAAIEFKRSYKPDKTIHLGDFADFTSFRTGAKGNKDESASVSDDVFAALNFLSRLEPTLVFNGNHEDRIFRLMGSPNAVISYAAHNARNALFDCITKELKAEYVEDYDIERSWRYLGSDCIVGHGWMFNEAAIRDHAEYHGMSCVIAHLHRQGIERARSARGATGYCGGFLGDKKLFTYAKHQRARAKWNRGFIYGDHSDKHTNIILHPLPCEEVKFQNA